MILFAALALLSLLAFLAVERSTTAREHFDDRTRWHEREAALCARWEAREKELLAQNAALLDRLLLRNAVEPVSMMREQTLKLPDVDTPLVTPIDEAVFDDEVLEEVEFHRPEITGLSADMVRREYPGVWSQMEAVVKARRSPLTIG